MCTGEKAVRIVVLDWRLCEQVGGIDTMIEIAEMQGQCLSLHLPGTFLARDHLTFKEYHGTGLRYLM